MRAPTCVTCRWHTTKTECGKEYVVCMRPVTRDTRVYGDKTFPLNYSAGMERHPHGFASNDPCGPRGRWWSPILDGDRPKTFEHRPGCIAQAMKQAEKDGDCIL